MKKFYAINILMLLAFNALAQPASPDIPLARRYFHDKIDASQKNILKDICLVTLKLPIFE